MFPPLSPNGKLTLKLFYLVCFQIDWMRLTSCTSEVGQNMVMLYNLLRNVYELIAFKQLWKLNITFSAALWYSTVFVFFPGNKVPASARQSVMSEASGATPPDHSSPRASFSHSYPRLSLYHSHNPLPQEGERLSFTLDDTFRELDEFQEDPPLFLEENSWEGDESELSDPTMTLLNHEHFQVSRVPV